MAKRRNPSPAELAPALCQKLRNPVWPESLPLSVSESMAEAAALLESLTRQAAELVAGLMADFVAQPEPGNPYRLDSVRAAVAFLETAPGGPGKGWGYDSGGVFRARLAAGTLGGRFKPPFLGADLEPLGRAARLMAEAERELAGTVQTRDRCKAGLALHGSDWTLADLETLKARAARERKAAKAARAAWAEELAKAKAGGLI